MLSYYLYKIQYYNTQVVTRTAVVRLAISDNIYKPDLSLLSFFMTCRLKGLTLVENVIVFRGDTGRRGHRKKINWVKESGQCEEARVSNVELGLRLLWFEHKQVTRQHSDPVIEEVTRLEYQLNARSLLILLLLINTLVIMRTVMLQLRGELKI